MDSKQLECREQQPTRSAVARAHILACGDGSLPSSGGIVPESDSAISRERFVIREFPVPLLLPVHAAALADATACSAPGVGWGEAHRRLRFVAFSISGGIVPEIGIWLNSLCGRRERGHHARARGLRAATDELRESELPLLRGTAHKRPRGPKSLTFMSNISGGIVPEIEFFASCKPTSVSWPRSGGKVPERRLFPFKSNCVNPMDAVPLSGCVKVGPRPDAMFGIEPESRFCWTASCCNLTISGGSVPEIRLLSKSL
eukprot:250913-Prymnesium_polylepis.1